MHCPKKSAFTLVELLVVISVIGVISSLGFAAYTQFSRSQIVTQAIEKIISDLHLAQSLALNNQKPEECGVNLLDGYSFEINDSTSYTISAVCGSSSFEVKKVTLPLTVAIGPSGWKATFKVLRQGVSFEPNEEINEIKVNAFGKLFKKIVVGSGGEINLKSFDEK
jgi:prepilin-type N-terminal cleavage/methylation domain-containing protein